MDNFSEIQNGGGNYSKTALEMGWRDFLKLKNPEEVKCPKCGDMKAWDEDLCPSCQMAKAEYQEDR